MTDSDDQTLTFEKHRRALIGAAYRILGSHSDAEDVVQETWIRWHDVDPSSVDDERAYLLTITSRLALNRLRQLRTRRESYVGPWLPEPVSTRADADGAAVVEFADQVSMAMLIVLESLSPLERAVFVLTDVFKMPAREVADALGRSPAAVRQLAHRARSHIEARQPRDVVDAHRHREVTQFFLAAATGGDVARLMAILSPDVDLVMDGGGIRKAALRPVRGAENVVRFLAGIMARPDGEFLAPRIATVNAEPAIVLTSVAGVDSVVFLTMEDGVITTLRSIRNPDKLGAVN